MAKPRKPCRCGCDEAAHALGFCLRCYARLNNALERFEKGKPPTALQMLVVSEMGRPTEDDRKRWPPIDGWVSMRREYLKKGPRNGARAYELRSQKGIIWRQIAVMTGYSSRQAATKAARVHAERHGKEWPC